MPYTKPHKITQKSLSLIAEISSNTLGGVMKKVESNFLVKI